MSVDCVIQFKQIVRFVAMMTVVITVLSAASAVEAMSDRYPLVDLKDEKPTTNQPAQQSPEPPPVLKTQHEAPPAANTDPQPDSFQLSMQATRDKFEKQFEQSYTRVASAMATPSASSGASTPQSDLDNSVLELDSHVKPVGLDQKENAGPAGQNAQSLVTLLPPISDVTERFPRVARTPADLNLGGANDSSVQRLPKFPNADDGSSQSTGNRDQLNWWNRLVTQPLHPDNQVQTVDSNQLVYLALENSPRLQAISRDPLIRDFEVIEADSAFDAVSFLQSQFADRSNPLGGALDATRDGSDTIENHQWTAEGGLRKRARTGATYELSQSLGFQNSNVAVFTPNNQGTAQIALNVTQPLARGRGRYINQSQILIAQSRGGAAWETFSADLQTEIEAVVSAYWRLYFDRSVFLQKKRNVERVAEILATLEGRANLDSLPSQITRARSSLQSRKTDLANALRDVRNSETELRRLIADRNWKANQFIELLPVEAPVESTIDISLDHVVTTSLEYRPEIRETLQRVKLAGIERNISVNDLLPELSLLLGTYVATLQDDGRFGRAFVDQFGETKPGYSVGLEFEMPIGNRFARTRLIQRELQLAKIKSLVDEAMQNVIAESQTALRRLTSAAETLQAANQAIEAANSDMKQNILRWENFALVEGDFSDGQTPTTVLDQLLDSQERLAASELVAAQSQLELKIAEVALQRAMGTLLIQKQINPRRVFESGSPMIRY